MATILAYVPVPLPETTCTAPDLDYTFFRVYLLGRDAGQCQRQDSNLLRPAYKAGSRPNDFRWHVIFSYIVRYARLELALFLFGRQTPHHIGMYPVR